MLYDIENGLRMDDRAARSFDYDPRPLVAGELGAGIFSDEEEVVNCYRNDPTYELHGCGLGTCVKHPNG
ncbi:hypothetical protein ACWDTQ_28310 [Streptomyces cellulosae]